MSKQEITATQGGFQTALQKAQSIYLQSVAQSLTSNNIKFDDEQRACVYSAISKLNEIATADDLKMSDFDQSNITKVLSQVALLRLNTNAIPRECGFQIRKVYQNGVVIRKEFEFFVEGVGNDKLLRKYGEGVKSLDNAWKVRKGDGFTFPQFNVDGQVPPTWQPKSYSQPIERVVYRVIKTDGRDEWLISDREEVATNLKAHIMNNARSADETTKQAIIDQIEDMTLDEMLKDKSLRTYKDKYGKEKVLISPSWIMPQSREAMIERKMMNNATKKYPKNFSNTFVREAFENTFEDYEQYREKPKLTSAEQVIETLKEQDGDDEITIAAPEATQAPVDEAEQTETPKSTSGLTFDEWKAQKIKDGAKGEREEKEKEDDLPF